MAWACGSAAFRRKSRSREVDAHRLIEPPAPVVGVAMRALIAENEAWLQPEWMNAEGFATKGSAEALAVTARLLAEKSTEWGEHVFLFKFDVADAFGSIRHDCLLHTCRKVGARTAVDMLRCVVGTSIRPRWLGLEGPEVCIGKGCRQDGAESPTFWNVVLDSATDEVCKHWQETGYGVRLPQLLPELRGRRVRNIADGANWLTHLAYADDILIVGESPEEVTAMHAIFSKAVAKSGLGLRPCV